MKIIDSTVYDGRNIHSHKKCIVLDVDLEGYSEIPSKDIKGFNEKLVKLLPILYTHRCGIDEEGGFVKRLKEGTYPLIENEAMEISGRNLVTGLPKTVTVTSAETERALQGTSNQIIEAIISVLERTPPELSADILERGIMLTGGGAKLRGLEEMIEERTGINTMTAEDPTKVVAIGTGEYVELMNARREL